ncbi:hypothetical protein O181_007629 [Austropuccinia psidii MF-1]|uniref:Uncharacterized protein n=1 Tax=Austropuccinia psidii MF-1 TaxID=1389203 RepID=A0A9Q3BMC4_9BASI|nr:hypothetical protein [Austropuccinia psidii MF-1]
MTVKNSPPERKTRSQARAQPVLTPTPRAPLDGNPEVPQLRAHLERGQNMEGAAPSRKEGRLDTRYHEWQKENNNVQEKKTEATKSSSSNHQNSSSSSQKKKNFHSQKRIQPNSSLCNEDFKVMGSQK